MGTRSLTKVIESYTGEDGKTKRETLTCMYRQYDGYLRGHGLELAEWLQKYTIVNGVIYDAKKLLTEVKEMVDLSKKKENFILKQPGN